MRWERSWFWPFRRVLVSRGQRIPTFIPAANEFAQKFAKHCGGTAMSMIPEILFDIPAPPTVSEDASLAALRRMVSSTSSIVFSATRICMSATAPWSRPISA